jgi:raffinose/stachyose/melibiose transport system substrate-binding protein
MFAKQRFILFTVVWVLLLIAAVGCAGQVAQPPQEEVAQQEQPAQAEESTEGEPVTLTVWSWRTEDEDAYNEIFDVYEAQNPGVTVEFVPSTPTTTTFWRRV